MLFYIKLTGQQWYRQFFVDIFQGGGIVSKRFNPPKEYSMRKCLSLLLVLVLFSFMAMPLAASDWALSCGDDAPCVRKIGSISAVETNCYGCWGNVSKPHAIQIVKCSKYSCGSLGIVLVESFRTSNCISHC